MTRAEACAWIKWFNALDSETQEAVEQASAAGAGVPAGMDRDEILELTDAADAVREDDPNAPVEAIEQAAAEKVRELVLYDTIGLMIHNPTNVAFGGSECGLCTLQILDSHIFSQYNLIRPADIQQEDFNRT